MVLRGYVYTTIDDERGTIKEPATALQITGEEDNIEAIEYFTSVFGSFSRANIRESKKKSKGFLHLIRECKRACTVNGLSFSVLDWWVRNSTISASNVDYCC
jgi:hypothetical protein